jgi:hypothetical protein
MRSRYATAFGVSCALHLLLVVLVAGLPRPSLTPVAAPPGKSIAVFVVPPTEDSTFKGLNPVDRSKSQWTLPPGDGGESLRIGGLDIDVGRIRARGLVLFPFLSPGLSLDYFVPPSRDDLRASLENPFAAARRRQARENQRPLSIAGSPRSIVLTRASSPNCCSSTLTRTPFSPMPTARAGILDCGRNWVSRPITSRSSSSSAGLPSTTLRPGPQRNCCFCWIESPRPIANH